MLHESDTIAATSQDDIYSVVSETSSNNTTSARCTDTEQDHIYDRAEVQNQINSSEQPQYNTLQHGNTANTETVSKPTFVAYDKIDINTNTNVQKSSKLGTQLQRSTHRTT